jgi:hypothetical protein
MNKTLWMMIVLVVLLAACEKSTEIRYANVCDRDNDGKLIETTGYLSDGNGVLCSDTRNGKWNTASQFLKNYMMKKT